MPNTAERMILVWGHRTERPDATVWNIGPSHAEQTAAVWPSLRHAINYVTGMQADREAAGMHPWIRTPQGHVYSPVVIGLMAAATFEADGRERSRGAVQAPSSANDQPTYDAHAAKALGISTQA